MLERNININIRVTDKEKKALERFAKRAGLSLSPFFAKSWVESKDLRRSERNTSQSV